MRTAKAFGMVAAALALAGIPSARGGTDPYELDIMAVGDFDGDGVPDVAVGFPDLKVGKMKEAGEIRIYSGGTGALILRVQGKATEEARGTSLAAIGDVDGDGATDLASGSYAETPLAVSPDVMMPSGKVEFLSGKTGKVIRTVVPGKRAGAISSFGDMMCTLGDGSGKAPADLIIRDGMGKKWFACLVRNGALAGEVGDESGLLGATLPVGDVDGDKVPDFAIGAWTEDVGKKKSAGRLPIISGGALTLGGNLKTELLLLHGTEAEEFLGLDVGPAGDWDGDGTGDLLVGRPGSDRGRRRPWSVRVLSGKDGSTVATFTGEARNASLGGEALLADLDEDAHPEIAVGNPTLNRNKGAVALLSSKDGKAVWTVEGASSEELGATVLACPDADGDGFPDLVVAAPGARVDGKKGRGRIRFLSGKTGKTLVLVNPNEAK